MITRETEIETAWRETGGKYNTTVGKIHRRFTTVGAFLDGHPRVLEGSSVHRTSAEILLKRLCQQLGIDIPPKWQDYISRTPPAPPEPQPPIQHDRPLEELFAQSSVYTGNLAEHLAAMNPPFRVYGDLLREGALEQLAKLNTREWQALGTTMRRAKQSQEPGAAR